MEFQFKRTLKLVSASLLSLHLFACGGGTDGGATVAGIAENSAGAETTPVTAEAVAAKTVTLSGSTSGLAAGQSLLLRNNVNANHKLIETNGAFTMGRWLANGERYALVVERQPNNQTCTLTNANGQAGTSDITNIRVLCQSIATTYSIGGTLSGLESGKSITLRNNGGDALTLNTNSTFAFATKLANAATYAVTVSTPPAGQDCAVTQGNGSVSGANVANIMVNCVPVVVPVPSRANKWQPGIYTKLEDWQTQSSTEMNSVFKDLATTPQLRGIKMMVHWGRHERKDSNGVIQRDFSLFEDVLARLAALNATLPANNQKHLILGFSWRTFELEEGVSLLLPNDLRGGGALWTGDVAKYHHPRYNNAWAYRITVDFGGAYAYNMKLWNPTILSRIDDFLAALAARVDSHPNFNHMSTTESATGEPVISYGAEGGTEAGHFAGEMAIVRMMRKHFAKSLVIPDLNFSQEHVANMVAIMQSEGIGLGSSNSNLSKGLNRTTPIDAPGVLTYYPKLSGKVPLAPELQGQDFRGGGYNLTSEPSNLYLYKRVRDDLKANYVVMVRSRKYWYGDTKGNTPLPGSMLKFIQTHPDIVNDTTGAGGLGHVQPSSL